MTLTEMTSVLTPTADGSGWFLYAVILMSCSLGFPFSSDLLMILAGSLASMGYLRFEAIFCISPVAILCGDTIAFYLGRRYGERILSLALIQRVFPSARQTQIRTFLQRNSRRFIFGIRFFPGLRSLIFVSAGSMHIPQKIFFQMNALSTFLYAPTLVTISFLATQSLQEIVGQFEGVSRGVMRAALLIVLVFAARMVTRRIWTKEEEEGTHGR